MKNADYFSNYVTEDFTTYINRKRKNNCHGNHIEMQAMAEMYNRPVEVYQYSTGTSVVGRSATDCTWSKLALHLPLWILPASLSLQNPSTHSMGSIKTRMNPSVSAIIGISTTIQW